MSRVTADNVEFGKVVWIIRYHLETERARLLAGVVYNMRSDTADIVVPDDPEKYWFKYGEAFEEEEEAMAALDKFLTFYRDNSKFKNQLKPGDYVLVSTPEFAYDALTEGIVLSVGSTNFCWKTRDGKERTVYRYNKTSKCSKVWWHTFVRIVRHIPVPTKHNERA